MVPETGGESGGDSGTAGCDGVYHAGLRQEKILDVGERHVLSEIQYRAKEQGIVVEELHRSRRWTAGSGSMQC